MGRVPWMAIFHHFPLPTGGELHFHEYVQGVYLYGSSWIQRQGMSLRALLGTAPEDLQPRVPLEAARLALLGRRPS